MGFKIPAKCEHCGYRDGIECTYGSPICPFSVQAAMPGKESDQKTIFRIIRRKGKLKNGTDADA